MITDHLIHIDPKTLKGRQRRLWHEWHALHHFLAERDDAGYSIVRCNAAGMPVEYDITFYIRSICGVENMDEITDGKSSHLPLFANKFVMRITLPSDYPSVDAPPSFSFLTMDRQLEPIPHPWHPNIRYFGAFAGRVCINAPDSRASLAWCVDRIAAYLRYDIYHANNEPPYPEDLKVASWVTAYGEPKGWIFFNQ